MGHAEDLLAYLHNYLLGVGKDTANVSALVRAMVHFDVEYRATAQQALRALQVLVPSNKAGGKVSAF